MKFNTMYQLQYMIKKIKGTVVHKITNFNNILYGLQRLLVSYFKVIQGSRFTTPITQKYIDYAP